MHLRQKTTKQPDAAAYRIPQPVKRILVFPGGDSYPICPRCGACVDREYMAFCSGCGQCLSWKKFDHAKICRAPRNG